MTKRIENISLAHDMALAEAPHRDQQTELWERGRTGQALIQRDAARAASAAVEAAFHVSESESGAPEELTVPVFQSDSASDRSERSAPAERNGQMERLKEIVAEGEFNATAWMRSSGSVPTDMGGGGHNRFQSFYSNPSLRPYLDERTPENLGEMFAEQGVSQLLTAELLDLPYGQIRSDTDKPAERTMLMTFETTAHGYAQFKYKDNTGRTGNVFRYNLFIPQSTATEFLQLAQADPTMLQAVGDIIMLDELHAGQDWEDSRPPYDEWRQQLGGNLKTAIRLHLDATPDDSMIVTTSAPVA